MLIGCPKDVLVDQDPCRVTCSMTAAEYLAVIRRSFLAPVECLDLAELTHLAGWTAKETTGPLRRGVSLSGHGPSPITSD